MGQEDEKVSREFKKGENEKARLEDHQGTNKRSSGMMMMMMMRENIYCLDRELQLVHQQSVDVGQV
jgi:hypothetical protein